jgi:hypothetical protein
MRFFDSAERSSGARTTSFVFLAWVTLSAITAVVGPFSTYDTMPIEVRFVYWGVIIGSAVILSEGIQKIVSFIPTSGPLQADILGSVLMGPTFGFAITVFNALTMGSGPLGVEAWITNTVVVLLVCCGVVVFRVYVRSLAGDSAVAREAKEPSDSSADLPSFLRDIDPEIGRSVRWIEADDHYLRVHAASGSARVLMRFRDALEELAHLPGLQVHRSHWVRIEAVDEVRPDGRRHVAVLSCGTEVPVSRSYLGNLEMAGLLPNDAASERQ